MKRKIVFILLLCIVFGLQFFAYQTKGNAMTDYTLSLPSEDSVLQNRTKDNSQRHEFQETGFTWRDSKGNEYPVYMARTGSCFVIRTSKSGENYKSYLGKDVSEQIRKVLSTRKKSL